MSFFVFGCIICNEEWHLFVYPNLKMAIECNFFVKIRLPHKEGAKRFNLLAFTDMWHLIRSWH